MEATGGTPRDRALLDWAVDLFEAAELTLPPTRVTFAPSRETCRGAVGRARSEHGWADITICTTDEDPEVKHRHAVVHELAHAWLDARLPGERRRAFLRQRALEHWAAASVPWRQRGTEHAAEIVTWGLTRHPVLMVQIPDKRCDRLTDGYALLTGRTPPGEGCRTF